MREKLWQIIPWKQDMLHMMQFKSGTIQNRFLLYDTDGAKQNNVAWGLIITDDWRLREKYPCVNSQPLYSESFGRIYVQ